MKIAALLFLLSSTMAHATFFSLGYLRKPWCGSKLRAWTIAKGVRSNYFFNNFQPGNGISLDFGGEVFEGHYLGLAEIAEQPGTYDLVYILNSKKELVALPLKMLENESKIKKKALPALSAEDFVDFHRGAMFHSWARKAAEVKKKIESFNAGEVIQFDYVRDERIKGSFVRFSSYKENGMATVIMRELSTDKEVEIPLHGILLPSIRPSGKSPRS